MRGASPRGHRPPLLLSLLLCGAAAADAAATSIRHQHARLNQLRHQGIDTDGLGDHALHTRVRSGCCGN